MMYSICIVFLAAVLPAMGGGGARDESLEALIGGEMASLIAIYQGLHRNPELSYRE